MNISQIVMFIGYEMRATVLEDGDTVAIYVRDGTAGFTRNGTPLRRAQGDDKFLGHEDCVRSMLNHFGISMNLISEILGVKVFKIFIQKMEPKRFPS